MAEQTIHAVIFKDAGSDQWVGVCLEYDVVTQGDSEEHAKEMLREAVELYLEDMGPDEVEVLHQPVEGDPKIHELSINAPTLRGEKTFWPATSVMFLLSPPNATVPHVAALLSKNADADSLQRCLLGQAGLRANELARLVRGETIQ